MWIRAAGADIASPVAKPGTNHMWGGFPTRPGASERRRRSSYAEQSEIRRFRSRTDTVKIAGRFSAGIPKKYEGGTHREDRLDPTIGKPSVRFG